MRTPTGAGNTSNEYVFWCTTVVPAMFHLYYAQITLKVMMHMKRDAQRNNDKLKAPQKMHILLSTL